MDGDFKNSNIFLAVKLRYFFMAAKAGKFLFIPVFFLQRDFFLFSVSLSLLFALLDLFFENKLKKPDFIDFDSGLVLNKSKTSTDAALKILNSRNKKLDFIFARLGLNRKNFLENFENFKNSQTVSIPVEKLFAGKSFISMEDILSGLANFDQSFQKTLFENDIKPEDFEAVLLWEKKLNKEIESRKKFWELENLLLKPGIGKQWAYGYTANLDRYSRELTSEPIFGKFQYHSVTRGTEIEKIERILSRAGKNNVLIIGEPGTGRKTIVRSFAKIVAEGKVHPAIENKRVLELDADLLLSGLNAAGEIRKRFETILVEAISAGNIILVIDEFHDFIKNMVSQGIDFSTIIIPYLRSPKFQLIAITNHQSYHRDIESNGELNILFEKVEIREPSAKETILILEDILPVLEFQYGLFVPYQTLKEIVNLADETIFNIPFPEKAVGLLTETMMFASQKNQKIVSPLDVEAVVSQKTGIPIGKIKSEEKEKLLNLEKLLHRRVINQEEGIKAVSRAMQRARTIVGDKQRPMGTFLFLGPTGVGKTETAKALAEIYFGSEDRMIRLDMSEYQEPNSIERLIGSADGKIQAQFANQLIQNPFSLVLIDEVEKAHYNILNLFLQILDEGSFTDALGRKISFKNAIIIATSNAGAEFIREYIEKNQNPAELKNKLIDFVLKQGIFRPEFINRFDAAIVFEPLSKENTAKIAILMLEKLNKRLLKKDIKIEITPELVNKLVEIGFHPVFGGRELRRVIQDKVEGLIAKNFLEGKYKRGEVIRIELGEI